MNKNIKSVLLAAGAAFIWGVAFVAQAENKGCPAFIFNAVRSWIAVPFLLLLILIVTKGDFKHILSEKDKESNKALWLGGILLGIALFLATFTQQHGMDLGTSAGKAGFITALYMILVPIGGIFIGKKTTLNTWIAAIIALPGLYLLCIDPSSFTQSGDSFRITDYVQVSDLWVLCCSLCFMFQILLIDHFSVKCNCIKLSCVQFITCAVLSTLSALIFNFDSLPELKTVISDNLIPLYYLGIFSSGVAYTLQMLAQKGANPTAVSITMSMESVFSVLAAFVIQGDRLTLRQLIGCVLMFCAVLCTQLTFGHKKALKAEAER